MASVVQSPIEKRRTAKARCQLCTCELGADGDLLTARLCGDCKSRPEARRLIAVAPSTGPAAPAATSPSPRAPAPRSFTAADRALIRKLYGLMPALDLLRILNDRLLADVGDGAVPYLLDQLQTEARDLVAGDVASSEWTTLRRVLAAARRDGTLAACTPQVVDDFAVVWQLSPAQVTHLRDVIRHAQEDA